jgi:hypothetical protein
VISMYPFLSIDSQLLYKRTRNVLGNAIPLHLAPQTSQVNTTFSSPFALSSKFPQPEQKTSDPIAAILKPNSVVDIRVYFVNNFRVHLQKFLGLTRAIQGPHGHQTAIHCESRLYSEYCATRGIQRHHISSLPFSNPLSVGAGLYSSPLSLLHHPRCSATAKMSNYPHVYVPNSTPHERPHPPTSPYRTRSYRAPTVDEALRYTPLTSIVPFSAGMLAAPPATRPSPTSLYLHI